MTWLRQFFRRSAEDRDLAREMEAPRAERMDDLVERGVPEDKARRQAALEFGNGTRYAEKSREVWLAPWLSGVWQDVHYAARTLVGQPLFSLSTTLILAL